MHTNDTITHHRRVFARLDEKELHDLLAKEIAKKMKFEIDSETKIRVIISKKDAVGSAGFERYAEVTLTNNLDT